MSSGAIARAAAPEAWNRLKELILPSALIVGVLVILVPLPKGLMDLLLACNITLSVIMLLTAVYVRTPLEFSIFPSLLLTTTLFRLVLNVATTRLILTRAASDGMLAAGGVVKAFGEFVTGGAGPDKIVVGLVIFAIIVVIQFVVITKGATRIGEVAARFTLDGMPGKQMAVDADLNAGLIDQQEARRRRREIAEQADFFGAMDGAAKFVRGDAIAGVVIIVIDILGGLLIGLGQHGMSLAEATALFTTLTIGDGLVSQVPAFLISIAAGMLVTRGSQETNLPAEYLRQLFSRPQALLVAGGFLGLLVFTSLPRIPLLLLAAACFGMAILLRRAENRSPAASIPKPSQLPKRPEQRIEDFLAAELLELELGVGLLRIADPQRGGDLLERIGRLRQEVAAELGVIMPKVRIRDNLRLQADQFRLKLADVIVAEHEVEPSAAAPAAAIVAALNEAVRQHAAELLNRQAVKQLLDELRKTSPAAVDELVPGVMRLGEVQQVLQELLKEGLSIRRLDAIVETLADWAPKIKNPFLLVERVRRRLAPAISARYRNPDKRLSAIAFAPPLESQLLAACEDDKELGSVLRLDPTIAAGVKNSVASKVEKLAALNRPPILLVHPQIRRAVKGLLAEHLPQLVVLSHEEITPDTIVETVAAVGGEMAGQFSFGEQTGGTPGTGDFFSSFSTTIET